MVQYETAGGMTKTRAIRVLIADDHPVVRRGLRQTIDEASDLEVSAEAGDGRAALEHVRADRCDVAVLDITMPQLGGLELLDQIRTEFPHIPVVILSMHDEERYALLALRRGAAAYLCKTHFAEELVEAIRVVIQGRRYMTAAVAEKLAHVLVDGERALPHESLSTREFQVMIRLARGMRNKDIADELHLSPKTVSSYRARTLDKLGLSSIADLARYAAAHRLLD